VVAPAQGAVRIAAFNVRRFFDTVCESGACGGSAYEALPNADQFTARANQLAAAITSLKADVVLLEEVETVACLGALRDRLPDFREAVLGETWTAASVDVGVLSRHPITLRRGHRDSTVLTRPDGTTTRFAREFLEVHLDVGGARVIVFPAHFRSKVDDDPGRRLAEAQAARTILTTVAEAHPGALVVLGGDLNDTPASPPLDALELEGALRRVASDRPPTHTGTYLYAGEWQALDHLYVTRDAASRYLPGSFRTVRDSSRGLGGSDHAAVLADFRLSQ
jgi:predicted extracellular nuclease